MGGFSIWHWLVVALVVMVLFGKGRISDLMGDLGKGIKSFKKGISEEDNTTAPPQVTHSAPPPQQPDAQPHNTQPPHQQN